MGIRGDTMGKRLVLYASAYGSTGRYASYIARRLSCEAVDIRHLQPEKLEGVDTVIFGGWLCGGSVVGSEKLAAHRRALSGKRLVVFITGAGEQGNTSRVQDIVAANFTSPVPEKAFYLRGDIRYRKLRWYHKFLINFLMFDDNNIGMKWLKQDRRFFDESQADRLILYIKSG